MEYLLLAYVYHHLVVRPEIKYFHHNQISYKYKYILFKVSAQLNQTALEEFNKILNEQASVRDYLIQFSTNLPINTPQSLQLQSSTLAQMTQATNQLTRNTAVKKIISFDRLIDSKICVICILLDACSHQVPRIGTFSIHNGK